MNLMHVLKQRSLCVFSCMLLILLLIAQACGKTDSLQALRRHLQSEGPEGRPLREWDEVTAAGQIRSIRRKDSGVTLLLASSAVIFSSAEGETRCWEPDRHVFIQVSAGGDIPDITVGSWIQAVGKTVYPSAPVCPGQFDGLQYADQNRILFSLVSAEIRMYAPDQNAGTWLETVKTKCSDAFLNVLSAEDAGILTAVTLGDKSGLSPDKRKLFQDGGISHILAISGLHINMAGMTVYRLLRKKGRSFALSALVSNGILLLYCEMTGMSGSAVRAAVMFAVWTGSQLAGRTPDTLTSLAAAAAVLLIRKPGAVCDGGFQMSFGCILSISLLSGPVRNLLCSKDTGKHGNRLVEMLAASIAVSVGTLPVSCRHYYQFSPYAPLLNLFVLPAMSVLILSGLAGACMGILFPPAGIWLAAPCHYLIQFFVLLCRVQGRLPFSVIVTGCPAMWQVILYYFMLLLILLTEKRFRMHLPKAVMLIAAVSMLCIKIPPGLRLVFLDVGQGDCILIQSGRKAVLVDGGSSSEDNIWSYRIEPCLKYYGVREIEGWFATHGDTDHISGIEECAGLYRRTLTGSGSGGITVRRFCTSVEGKTDPVLKKLLDAWNGKGVETAESVPGDMIRSENFRIRVMYPKQDDLRESGNENSLVMLLEIGPVTGKEQTDEDASYIRVLLTGDLEREGEEVFRQRWENLGAVDILKLGHHGSRYATSELFLQTFRPSAAVASCGRNNRYGHPSSYTLQRLEQAGTVLYRTDLQGSIIFQFRRKHLSVEQFIK